MNRNIKTGAAVVIAGALFAAGGMGTATAAKMISGSDIEDNSITSKQLAGGSVGETELKGNVLKGIKGEKGDDGRRGPRGETGPAGVSGTAGAEGTRGAQGVAGPAGPAGTTGPQGPVGPSGYEGAFYAVANYDVGDTNAGAIATVACDSSSQAFTAVAGGVQSLGLGGAPAAVASSFPGRMDWSTNSPKANRLDGWVIQFDADQAPTKVKIWALCVPRTNIPVVQTYLQSAG
jgi:hypothetical protein